MSKKKDEFGGLLNKQQQEDLQNMVNDMFDIASDLVSEYGNIDTSELRELSGSITQINENSPFLDEIFKGDSWKRVIKPTKPLEDKDAD